LCYSIMVSRRFGFGATNQAHRMHTRNYLTLAFLLTFCASGYCATNFIGYNGVNWDTTGKVNWRSSSAHPSRNFGFAINGTGIKGDGTVHSNMIYGDPPPAAGQGGIITMGITSTLSLSQGNPRGGTVPGGHWVEFSFDQIYTIGEMWLWNYNENCCFDGSGGGTNYPADQWTAQGMREVTIQVTAVGGGGGGLWGSNDPADWTTVFSGDIPQALGRPEEPVSLVVNFGGIPVRYLVITTTANPARLNWTVAAGMSGVTDAGFGEIRFFEIPKTEGSVLFVK